MPHNLQPTGPIKLDPKALKTLDADPIIINTTRAYVEADVQVPSTGMQYKLTDKKDNFARVSVGVPQGGGYYILLKNVHDIWVVIVTGQDLPGKDIGKKYGLPEGWYSNEY